MTVPATELARPDLSRRPAGPLGRGEPRRRGVHLPRSHLDLGASGTTGYAALAGGLRALGVGRGDVVSFLDKNHPACVELTLAAGVPRAPPTRSSTSGSAGDEVDYAVNDSGAKVLLVGSELMPLIEKIRDRLTTVEKIIEVTPEGGDGDAYEALLAAAEPARPRPPRSSPTTCAW